MYVARRPSNSYPPAQPGQPEAQSPSSPPHSPKPSRLLLLTVVSQALIGNDNDSLWRAIDVLLSQVMLLTEEELPRDQVRQGSRRNPHPNPFLHPCMPLCASLRPLVESAPAASHS